jgi:hypothetical protein
MKQRILYLVGFIIAITISYTFVKLPSKPMLDQNQTSESHSSTQKFTSQSDKLSTQTSNQTTSAPMADQSPDIKDPAFKPIVTDYYSKVPEKMRSRVQIKITGIKDNSVWTHLLLDDIPVEMTEARSERENGAKVYKIKTGGLVQFPEVKNTYKDLSPEKALQIVNESDHANTIAPTNWVGEPKKLWAYKPGLTPMPVLEIKIKTPESKHSGEVYRIDTMSGKIIKKYQNVRH